MPINFIPNDPGAGAGAPPMRVQVKRPNRPTGRAGFTFSNPVPEKKYKPGTPEFLFWQCRQSALATLEAWESVAGTFKAWQGKRKKLPLLPDEGVEINAFYNRISFSFFHETIGQKTFFTGASTDVVAHEIGHGLLDAIRPELWDATFLEAGAFHEAFGDCIAVLTALHDRETRVKLLTATKTLKKRNFLETWGESLSAGIRLANRKHNAAQPRHLLNKFKFQIPETLPINGGPGKLINEVHSFSMVFTGCFYDLIAGIFSSASAKTEANLLAAARTAGSLLVTGAANAVLVPRFFQSVGRAMELADDKANKGAHRQQIRAAFKAHNITLGAGALLAPRAVLAGKPPRGQRAAALGTSTRRDLAARLGVPAGTRMSVGSVELSGQRFARVEHTQQVSLGAIDDRLKGVTVSATVPVLVGDSGGRAAVMGEIPEPVSTEREVHAFVESLVKHGQVEFDDSPRGGGPRAAAAARSARVRRGTVSRGAVEVPRETHRVVSTDGGRTLTRVRFICGCY